MKIQKKKNNRDWNVKCYLVYLIILKTYETKKKKITIKLLNVKRIPISKFGGEGGEITF